MAVFLGDAVVGFRSTFFGDRGLFLSATTASFFGDSPAFLDSTGVVDAADSGSIRESWSSLIHLSVSLRQRVDISNSLIPFFDRCLTTFPILVSCLKSI